MLATRERVTDGRAETTVWHKAVAPCDGQCDFHQVACSPTDGIAMPGPQQDVPLDLDEPGERWCLDCLALITDGLAELFVRLGPPPANTTKK